MRKRRYQKENPAQFNYHASLRRASRGRATPPWVDKSIIKDIYAEVSRRGMHVDHIFPLKHKLFCGLHVPWNLQLLSKDENFRKSNRHFPPLTYVGEAIYAPQFTCKERQ